MTAAARWGAAWPWWLGAVLWGGAIASVAMLNGYHVFVLAQVALLAVVGIGLNVLLGLSGQVSFGHVGFYALGAYTVAILTSRAGLSFWLAWPLATLLAGGCGALLAIPALRVKGPYLAMVTIAFGFIVEHGAAEWRGLTGGQNGLMGIAAPSLFGVWQAERAVAVLALLSAAACLVGFTLLARSGWGAAMRAVRDSETAAESIGIQPLPVKVMAFALSAALAGLAGGLFAPLSGFVTPGSFAFVQSILFVLVVMLGGAGAVLGPVYGALVVGLLPELLSGLEEYRLLLFGALLMVVLWVAPGGVAALVARLHSAGVAAAQRWRRARPSAAARAVAHPPVPPAAGASDPSLAQADRVAARTDPPLGLPARPRPSLQARALGRVFGGVRAVHALDLDVAPGAVTSLIGPNGAGKTTALNMLSGFYLPSHGEVRLGAHRLDGQAAHAAARAGVARTYQTSQLFGSLGVLENVVLALGRGRLGRLWSAQAMNAPSAVQRARGLLAACGYHGDLACPAADLPHVDRRVVEIARALATDPDVLLLDEPAAGLSQEDKQALSGLLRRIAQAGVGVLLVEHDMGLVMGVSDRVVVLDAGQRIAEGSPAEVQADPAVLRAYLGEPGAATAVGAGGVAASATAGPARPLARDEHGRPVELLYVGQLRTGYRTGPVLHGLSLRLRQGEVLAVLGANGAGKSTLMRALAGLQRPVQGGIALAREDLVGLPVEQIVARGLVLVPEGRQVFPELSVLDNLRLGAFLTPAGRDRRVEDMLQRFPRLRERLQQRAGLLSGGEQQMLAVARGLMARPRLLLLDEPSLGLAPLVTAELFVALARLRDEGMSLIVVDQVAALALAVADRALVLEGGRVLVEGTAAEVAANPALARAYLGH